VSYFVYTRSVTVSDHRQCQSNSTNTFLYSCRIIVATSIVCTDGQCTLLSVFKSFVYSRSIRIFSSSLTHRLDAEVLRPRSYHAALQHGRRWQAQTAHLLPSPSTLQWRIITYRNKLDAKLAQENVLYVQATSELDDYKLGAVS